jgi:hypothetical protein
VEFWYSEKFFNLQLQPCFFPTIAVYVSNISIHFAIMGSNDHEAGAQPC